jgi:hypothetical protein
MRLTQDGIIHIGGAFHIPALWLRPFLPRGWFVAERRVRWRGKWVILRAYVLAKNSREIYMDKLWIGTEGVEDGKN